MLQQQPAMTAKHLAARAAAAHYAQQNSVVVEREACLAALHIIHSFTPVCCVSCRALC
jgi:hypothetical protein